MRDIYEVLEELRFIANYVGEDGLPYAESSLNAQLVDILEGYIKKIEMHLIDIEYEKAYAIVKQYLYVPVDKKDIFNYDIKYIDEWIKTFFTSMYNDTDSLFEDFEEEEDYED